MRLGDPDNIKMKYIKGGRSSGKVSPTGSEFESKEMRSRRESDVLMREILEKESQINMQKESKTD